MKQILMMVLAAFAEQVLACQITPLEQLFRGVLRSPLLTLTASKSNQFAGRTTIASGSASQVVSTSVINSDSLLGLALEAALPAGYTTRGTVAFTNSAAISVTVSTTAVYSGQAIGVSLFSATATGSLGAGAGLRVNSIVNGVSFAISTVDSGSIGTTDPVAMWHIDQAEPRGIKVNTIAPGTHFILGWADGQARPVDATVMWEIRRAS